MSSVRTLIADRGDAGLRLDLVLRRHLTDVRAATRTRVQAWIEGGQVAVNGHLVRRVSTRAAHGDIVTVRLPAGESNRARVPETEDPDVALAMLHVLHEDDDLLVLDKPAGVVVHPTYKHANGTLIDALRWYARAWPAGRRPSLVGRLDKLTSGIVVVAKSAAVHAALQKEMASSRSEKDYLAVVYGRVNAARGAIDLRLGPDRNDRRRIVASTAAGAPCLTTFVRMARAGGVSLLRCRLMTGRRHQIRVHLSARGWPIVGDPDYLTTRPNGEPRWSVIPDAALASALRAFPRQALHSWRVTFTHPATRNRLALEAPVPGDIDALLAAAGLALFGANL